MSSSKPIEDEIQVREVGESSRVNKIDINSQSLPLPPMTVNQFEDAVANIAKEIIDFGKPTESIDISNLSTNSESISTTQIDDISSEINKVSQAQVPVVPVPSPASPAAAPEPAKAEDPETTLSGIESAITELLSKLDSIKGSSSGGGGGGDLTTRDYVDQVLGGERNLEGGNLVDVANFVGKDDGISLRQEEDGSFTKLQDGEVVQEGMTQREANDFVQEQEQKEAGENDKTTPAEESQDPDSPLVETTIEKDIDVATEEARPFSFSTNYLIIVTYSDSQDFYDIFEEIRNQPPAPLNGFYYIECTVTDGEIVSTEFKSGGSTIWVGSVSNMIEKVNGVQTKAYIPVAMESGGELFMLNTGGCYSETTFCVDGAGVRYPMRLA